MTGQGKWGGMRGEGRPAGAATGLYSIIALKLGKSLLLLGITVGFYSLLDQDLQSAFEQFLLWVRLDPEHQFFADLGAKLQIMTPSSLAWIASGTLLYALLLLVESLGMMFRVFWAAWLAIGETAFFIPIEIYHLLRDFSPVVFIILVINVAVVWYLVKHRNRLFHHVTLAPRPSSAPGESGPTA